jgi:hypothetical protein
MHRRPFLKFKRVKSLLLPESFYNKRFSFIAFQNHNRGGAPQELEILCNGRQLLLGRCLGGFAITFVPLVIKTFFDSRFFPSKFKERPNPGSRHSL